MLDGQMTARVVRNGGMGVVRCVEERTSSNEVSMGDGRLRAGNRQKMRYSSRGGGIPWAGQRLHKKVRTGTWLGSQGHRGAGVLGCGQLGWCRPVPGGRCTVTD
jgi:hypothetical protein